MGEMSEQVKELIAMVRDDYADGAELEAAAARIAGKVPARVARWMAAAYLTDQVRHAARQQTLAAEQAAIRVEIMQETASRSHPRPGTRGYAEWAKTTEEGARDAAYRAENARREGEIRARHVQEMTAIIKRYTQELRMEWTSELLASTFALGDGTVTTWGAATVAQHEERRSMFLTNAAGNMEGAARHAKALEALNSAHVGSLDEMLLAEPVSA